VALEDKTVVDAFWDRAGVARLPSAVVGLDEAPAAAERIDRGDGTVWAADARDGFNGGASATFRVRSDDDCAVVADRLRGACDRVRVMPFVEGIPCSVHGIVLPDGIAVLRPVELVTLRRGETFVYAGCATFWDPDTDVRAQMRTAARRAGTRLAEEVGFRGAFTVDGVAATDGFWPTELNPRFGAGIMTIARGTGLPILLLNDLVVAGDDIGRSASLLEAEILEQADAQRSGGTWRSVLGHELVEEDRAAVFADGWRWARPGEPAAGRVTAGPAFVRCRYEPDAIPVGPSTVPLATAFWDFLGSLGVEGAGGLDGAAELRP
jgi:hypothetical protein